MNRGCMLSECRIPYCNFSTLVVGDDLTGALQVLQLQFSPPPPSSLATIKSRMEIFWYQLTQVLLENGY